MDPVALTIGMLEIRWYGIMMALSMLLGAWIATLILRRHGRDGDLVWDSNTFFLYGIFGLVGLIILKMYLPETKGKSLEELEKILVKS